MGRSGLFPGWVRAVIGLTYAPFSMTCAVLLLSFWTQQMSKKGITDNRVGVDRAAKVRLVYLRVRVRVRVRVRAWERDSV
jgi:hypothetical protein